MTAEEWWLSPLRFHVSLFLLQCILAVRSCLISPSWCLPIHRMTVACFGKLHLIFYLEKTWCFKTTSWSLGLMKKHSSSVLVSSNMLGGEMGNSETISFPFTSWISRAYKQVLECSKRLIQHFWMSGKSVSVFWMAKDWLEQHGWGVSSSWLWWWVRVATDLQVWAAQCCWLSVSRCSTEALDSLGTWVRAPTARKYILDFFKQENSVVVHANLGQYHGKALWRAEIVSLHVKKLNSCSFFCGIKNAFRRFWEILNCKF